MRDGLKPAVFLDRDGTINEEVNYLSRPEDARLIPGAGPAVARLNRAGFQVVVISNQSGLARGYFDDSDLAKVQAELGRQLAAFGAHIDAYYICPHLPPPHGKVPELAFECDCRKPEPGLIIKAAGQMHLDLGASFMVGDRLKDVACGHRAGVRGILVQTGHDDGPPAGLDEAPEFVAADLAGAVNWILAQSAVGDAA